MTTKLKLTPGDRILAERAAAHALAEVRPDARFTGGVTDLDVARLLRALEGNPPVRITRNDQGRWYAEPNRITGRAVSPVVNEMIRTGLLAHVRDRGPSGAVTHVLVPAKVHLRKLDELTTRCGEPGEGQGPKRVRLVSDPIMVDCLACLATL